jgi:hypothetical protein
MYSLWILPPFDLLLMLQLIFTLSCVKNIHVTILIKVLFTIYSFAS